MKDFAVYLSALHQKLQQKKKKKTKRPELQKDLWGTKYFCESGLKCDFIYACVVAGDRTR